MPSPVIQTPYGSYRYFLAEIGEVMGFGRSVGSWDHEQFAQASSILSRGLFQFYFAPSLPTAENQRPKPPPAWSFLFPVATLSLTADTATYDLPFDFSGSMKDLVYSSQNDSWRVTVVSPEKLRQVKDKGSLEDLDIDVLDHETQRSNQDGTAAPTGLPVVCCVEPINQSGLTRQRYQITFYPTPHKAITLTYRYQIAPDELSDTNIWPLGTTVHTETILASCLDVIHKRYQKGTPSAPAIFMERLAASIAHDANVGAQTGDIFPVLNANRGDLTIDYFHLQRHVGNLLQLGWNAQTWSYEERRRVDEIIDSGLRRYYYPDPIDAAGSSHKWSFLQPIGSLVTADGNRVYALPADFERLVGPMTYADQDLTDYPEIQVTSEARLRTMQHAEDFSAPPQYCAVRVVRGSGMTDQKQELVLHPTPDGEYRLEFQYHALQRRLTAAAPVPLGGPIHGEGILQSCLAVAEESQGTKNGPHFQAYMRRLQANIMSDMQRAPQHLGNYDDISRGGLLGRTNIGRYLTYRGDRWEG
ncbi:MAG: hypothetical protein E6Q97_17400 [Desulfurellales bacterium]|nr:MAG: hypothetical protein E6Q97_17400 [Desulfurellales bacterium]